MLNDAQIEQVARNDEQHLALSLRACAPAQRDWRACAIELKRSHELLACGLRGWPEEALGYVQCVRGRLLSCISAHKPDHALQPGHIGGAARAGCEMRLCLGSLVGGEAAFGQIDQPGKWDVIRYIAHSIITSSCFQNS